MQEEEPLLRWDHTICRHCGACTSTCMRGALTVGNTGMLCYDITRCIRCGSCTRACPSGALRARARKQ